MRKRKTAYRARRWIASEARRDRRKLMWGVSFAGLDRETRAEVARYGFRAFT